jgi:hypothetical membrane protein
MKTTEQTVITSDKSTIQIAGLLFFLAGSIILMGIITAEAFYPSGYTTANSEISDLGATRPPNSIIQQPSATIFNTTMLVTGLMVLIGSFFQHNYFKKWQFSVPFFLFAIGLTGVGIFPGNIDPYHGICSLLTFTMGGLSAILCSTVVSSPFRYVGIVFGLITLITLFTAQNYIPIIGDGGTERWVAYPTVLWLVGFGGYLLNEKK